MEPERLDLAAALLRSGGSDAQVLAEALATKLAGALPDQCDVRRKSAGLLSRAKRVTDVDVRLGDETFSLSVSGGTARASRAKVVGGIVIKREELPLERWLASLEQALSAEAERSESARLALERLLD